MIDGSMMAMSRPMTIKLHARQRGDPSEHVKAAPRMAAAPVVGHVLDDHEALLLSASILPVSAPPTRRCHTTTDYLCRNDDGSWDPFSERGVFLLSSMR